ncbi:MAG: hypothetical protein ABI833_23880, partial [Acidobacteriota bacterium]
QFEELLDELNLTSKIAIHPPNLPLPHHNWWLRNPESFALPPGTLEILAWRSLGLDRSMGLARGYC